MAKTNFPLGQTTPSKKKRKAIDIRVTRLSEVGTTSAAVVRGVRRGASRGRRVRRGASRGRRARRRARRRQKIRDAQEALMRFRERIAEGRKRIFSKKIKTQLQKKQSILEKAQLSLQKDIQRVQLI